MWSCSSAQTVGNHGGTRSVQDATPENGFTLEEYPQQEYGHHEEYGRHDYRGQPAERPEQGRGQCADLQKPHYPGHRMYRLPLQVRCQEPASLAGQ